MTWPLGISSFPQASDRHEDSLECITQVSGKDLQDTDQCSVEPLRDSKFHVGSNKASGSWDYRHGRCKMLSTRDCVMIGFKE